MFAKIIITFLVIFQISHGNTSIPLLPKSGNDDRDSMPHIIGGTEAPDGYATHMVALVAGIQIRMLACGGSIVTRRHVLSAAHCIEPYAIWGELSPHLKGVIGSNSWRSTEYVISFSGHINHPDFSWRTLKNDIGLLVTVEDIQYSDRIQPIALNWNWVPGRSASFATGWGLTSTGIQIQNNSVIATNSIPERLQLLYVNTISPLMCIIGVRNASSPWASNPPVVDPNLEICTFHSKGHGMCNGDSGSALVLQRSGEQIGIVVWGFPCAIGAPDVFARISAFKTFLMPIIGDHLNM